MTITLAIPAEEPLVDVSTALLFEPKLPYHLHEALHKRLYNGVHGGISAAGLIFPESGMTFKILRLQIIPLPETSAIDRDIERLGNALEAVTRGAVDTLWTYWSDFRALGESP